MPDRDDRAKADRRNFLKLAGIGTLTGGAAMALGDSTAEASTPSKDGSAYRETDHVKTYYESTRF